MNRPSLLLSLAVLGPVLATASCSATDKLADPTILVETPAGSELGVSTDFGIVFLGRRSDGGESEVYAWFGDGLSVELAAIEPLGEGLYTAEPEIRLPSCPMTFVTPGPGSQVTVRGRSGTSTWETGARVTSDPRVQGLLLRPTGRLTGAPEQIGAGVFVGEDLEDYELLGLVSGRIRIEDAEGRAQEYVTVVGPRDLWRVVAHRRDYSFDRRWVYREDIM